TTTTSAATAADAARHRADALADLRLLLRARGLRLDDSQLHHVLALAHAGDHLGPVEVGESQLDEARLDPGRGLHEHALCAVRPEHAAARVAAGHRRGIRTRGAGPAAALAAEAAPAATHPRRIAPGMRARGH